jgi:hypothetical protein
MRMTSKVLESLRRQVARAESGTPQCGPGGQGRQGAPKAAGGPSSQPEGRRRDTGQPGANGANTSARTENLDPHLSLFSGGALVPEGL